MSNFGQGVKKFTAENSAAKFYPNQIAYLRGKRYETEKKLRGGQRENSNAEKRIHPNDGIVSIFPSTSAKLAKEYGVGSATIERNGSFAKVVDVLPENAKSEVLSGRDTIRRDDVSTILKFDKTTQKKFLKEVESGTPIKEAVKKL